MLDSLDLSYFTMASVIAYSLGGVCAVYALWRSRTTQGATAWVVALLGFPFVMVPLFLVFGRNRFYGYVKKRKDLDEAAHSELRDILDFDKEQVDPPAQICELQKIANLSRQPGFTDANTIELLIDGKATYASMHEAIRKARKYILFQFYIIRDDESGQVFKDLLITKAREGVKIYFLFDGVGTSLHRKFLKDLRDAGVLVSKFNSTKYYRVQINFRNHRKNLVIDGTTAFIGGLNIGDDYLGKDPKVGAWRDTHSKICGPAALSAQIAFVKDWLWAEEKFLDLDWEPTRFENGAKVMIQHTGPADKTESALLAHVTLVNSAKTRCWIANPYVVPPEALSDALALAALRGVDVRILVPSKNDNILVQFASEVGIEKLLPIGVKFYKYLPGFLHQKVILIDDTAAVVGSTNLDSRSLFVNFEIGAVTDDANFLTSVEAMLQNDFRNSKEVCKEDLEARSLVHQVFARAVTLLSPVL